MSELGGPGREPRFDKPSMTTPGRQAAIEAAAKAAYREHLRTATFFRSWDELAEHFLADAQLFADAYEHALAEQPREGDPTSNRKATTMARRHRLSTHLLRRTARNAQDHYEQLQYEATVEGVAGEAARKMLADLGVGLTQTVKVERAKYERGKWVVVAE